MTHDEAAAFFRGRQEKYNRRDARALAADHVSDAVVLSPMFPRVEGLRDIEASYRSLFAVFPDWEIEFEDAIVDGDRAAQPFSARATHVGEFMGLSGTGRRFEVHGVIIYRLRNGLIVEQRRVYDFTALLIQLGVLRSKPGK